MTEDKENINPAIIHDDTALNEMSAEEFQRTLYTWFEDRGLLSELRAHLRRQMIGILKDTTLGQSVSRVQNLSPKTQVINLLIAEFLLKYKYHYSLSVFSTEVPFVSILPEFSSSLLNSPATSGDQSVDRKFTEQNFWDILQTIGLSQESKEGQVLYDYYFKSEDEPLIICLLRFMTNLSNFKKIFKSEEPTENVDVRNYEPWLKDVYNLLTSYELEGSMLNGIIQSIKIIFEREESRIRGEEQAKSDTCQEELHREIQAREQEIHKMVDDMEKNFMDEKHKILTDLDQEKDTIDKLKAQLVKQKEDVELKMDGLEKREVVLKQREQDLDTQTDILRTRIKVMQNVYDSIIEENKKINDIRMELQRTHLEHLQPQHSEELFQRLQSEYEYLRNEINETKNTIQKLTISEENLTAMKEMVENPELKLLKGMLERIQVENSELRCVNSEQQQKLEELSFRNSVLMSELESTQTTINLLVRNHRDTLMVPPLAAPASASRRGRTSISLSGAGENLGFQNRPLTQPSYRYSIPQFSVSRSKTPRRIIIHSGADCDTSPSPTDEILNEARQRLRRLEEETEVVDRSYRAFRQKHGAGAGSGSSHNGSITKMLHGPADAQVPSTSKFDPLYTNANFNSGTPPRASFNVTLPSTSYTSAVGKLDEAILIGGLVVGAGNATGHGGGGVLGSLMNGVAAATGGGNNNNNCSNCSNGNSNSNDILSPAASSGMQNVSISDIEVSSDKSDSLQDSTSLK